MVIGLLVTVPISNRSQRLWEPSLGCFLIEKSHFTMLSDGLDPPTWKDTFERRIFPHFSVHSLVKY